METERNRLREQVCDLEGELEELRAEVEEGRERERREGVVEEQLRASVSLAGVEREKMELKLASQEEAMADLNQEVSNHQTQI